MRESRRCPFQEQLLRKPLGWSYCTVKVTVLLVADCVLVLFLFVPELNDAWAITEYDPATDFPFSL
jgi:hypothetical protein